MNGTFEQLLGRAKGGDRDAAQQLLLENNGLVWSVVRRFYGRGVDPDDLYQLGCLGFLKALEGFDPAFGTQFSTYAVPKISGEIRRFLRDDGAVKVSRAMKEQAAAIKIARQQLTAQLFREPTLSELAEKTGLSPEEIAVAETATSATESIQKQTGEDGFSLEDVLTKGDPEEAMIERIALREAIGALAQRERLVIELRYFRAMTQEQVARVLQVSQVQVSRIEKKDVTNLRGLLQSE